MELFELGEVNYESLLTLFMPGFWGVNCAGGADSAPPPEISKLTNARVMKLTMVVAHYVMNILV